MRLVPALAAILIAGGCNMADGRDERESAKDRAPREARDRAREPEPRQAVRKLEDAGLEPQPQLASSAAPDPNGVSRAWFAGRWTDSGDCAQAGTFSPDGTFSLANGTRGMWNIRGGRLVVQGSGGRRELQLRRVDDDTVEVLNPDGSYGRSIRC